MPDLEVISRREKTVEMTRMPFLVRDREIKKRGFLGTEKKQKEEESTAKLLVFLFSPLTLFLSLLISHGL